jgi:hypothetical protein
VAAYAKSAIAAKMALQLMHNLPLQLGVQRLHRRSSMDSDKNKQKLGDDFLEISLSHGHAPICRLFLRYIC